MSTDPTTIPAEEAALMERYGILQATVDQFRYKRYLYSRLSDAIAQARRDHPST